MKTRLLNKGRTQQFHHLPNSVFSSSIDWKTKTAIEWDKGKSPRGEGKIGKYQCTLIRLLGGQLSDKLIFKTQWD